MKKLSFLAVALLFISISRSFGGTNNNAVLVCGTTVEHGKSPRSPFWDGGREIDKTRNEFWNDIFLMWEILYANQRCSLYVPEGTPPAEKNLYDHIWVLFGEGHDYIPDWPRYRASSYELEQITDLEAIEDYLRFVLGMLAEEMTDDDILFTFLHNHGAPGEHFSVLDASNPEEPSELGHYYYYFQELRPTAQDVFVFENRAYIARGTKGLDIFDISDPESPEFLGGVDTYYAMKVQVSRDPSTEELYAYLADYRYMRIINVTNPAHPQIVFTYTSPIYDYINDISVHGDHAYLAVQKNGGGLEAVNISNPLHPNYCSSIDVNRPAYDIHVSEDFPDWDLCAALTVGGVPNVYLIDVSSPSAPSIERSASIPTSHHPAAARDVFMEDTIVYVLGWGSVGNPENTKVYVLGAHLQQLDDYSTPGLPVNMFVSDSYAYVAYDYSKLKVLNVSDPTDVYEVSCYDEPAWVWGVYASGDQVYIVGGGSGGYTYLCLWPWDPYPDVIPDTTFARLVNQVPCKMRAFIMQPCFSGGFVSDLRGGYVPKDGNQPIPHTATISACAANESAWPAEDLPPENIQSWLEEEDYPWHFEDYTIPGSENEIYEVTGTPYNHGEMSLYTMNALRGQKPTGDELYRNPDLNNDLLISMDEVYEYLLICDSWQYPHYFPSGGPTSYGGLAKVTPQYSSDLGIGSSYFFGWDDGYPPTAPGGLYIDAIGLYPRYAAVLFDWLPNSEADLVGYYIYRREDGGVWVWRGSSRENRYEDICSYDTHYYYRVTAIDLVKNESGASNVVHVYVPRPKSMMIAGIGEPSPSPYLVQRTDYRNWGGSFEYTVDYDTEELIYRFEGLNPEKVYLIALIHYAGDSPRIQALSIDGLSLLDNFSVTERPAFDAVWIPQGTYEDGEILVNINKVMGDDAVISEIVVAEFDTIFEIYGGGGGSQTASDNIPIIHSLSIYPNPTKNNMNIKFGIPREERVSVKVYDVSGREVKTLVDERLEAGYHAMRLDGKNLPSGVYFARLVTDNYKATKKLVLMK